MRLLISCPNCQTSYELDEKQVMEAGGQVRCYNCGEVFNAVMHSEPVIGDGDDSMHVSSVVKDYSELLEQNPPTRPKTPPASQTDIKDESLELSPNSQIAPDRIEQVTGIKSSDLPELEPLTTTATTTTENNYSASSTFTWILLCLLLLIAALAQLGWQNRYSLASDSSTRSLIENTCNSLSLPCNLPARKDVSQFVILDRVIESHPEVKGVLAMKMLLSNQADFSQPAPVLTLSLFDAGHQLIARRSFFPSTYLQDRPSTAPLMEPKQTLVIALNLEDPGTDVTGFEFDFF